MWTSISFLPKVVEFSFVTPCVWSLQLLSGDGSSHSMIDAIKTADLFYIMNFHIIAQWSLNTSKHFHYLQTFLKQEFNIVETRGIFINKLLVGNNIATYEDPTSPVSARFSIFPSCTWPSDMAAHLAGSIDCISTVISPHSEESLHLVGQFRIGNKEAMKSYKISLPTVNQPRRVINKSCSGFSAPVCDSNKFNTARFNFRGRLVQSKTALIM